MFANSEYYIRHKCFSFVEEIICTAWSFVFIIQTNFMTVGPIFTCMHASLQKLHG